jgi:transposase-like protein
VVGGQEDGGGVLRLLHGEPLEVLSRELAVEAHRLAAWRDDFLEGGKDALKGQRPDRSPDDRALRQAERKVGQLTMENEILRAAAEKRGSRSRRRSGPASRGTPAAGGGGVPGPRRAPLQRVRPPRPGRCRWPAGPGHLDQRPRLDRADPPGPGRLNLRRGGLPQDPGSAPSRAQCAGQRQTGAAPAQARGAVGAPASPWPPQATTP